MSKTNETDGSPWSGHVNRHVHGFKRADTLQDRFGPTTGLLEHFLHCLLIARRDDIGGPKACRPGRHRVRRLHRQSRPPCCLPSPVAHGRMMSSRHDIGEGKDGLEQLLVAFNRGRSITSPSAYGTRTASPWPPSLGPPQRAPCTHELGKPARQNSQMPSDIMNGEITRSPFLMVRTCDPDLLDNPHPLVPHAITRRTVIDAAIRP